MPVLLDVMVAMWSPMRFAGVRSIRSSHQCKFSTAAHQRRSGGSDKPGDRAGSLVQAVAETLAGLVFAQLVDQSQNNLCSEAVGG